MTGGATDAAALPEVLGLTGLAIAWGAYFTVHSLLAGNAAKGWLATLSPVLARRYRLLYNAIALLTLLPVLILQGSLASEPVLSVPPLLRIALDLFALAAVLTFLWTLRYYDTRAFLGLPAAQPDSFTLSPLHRHVRHPWYFLALIIIWTRPLDPAWLVAAAAITTYLVIGSRLEDRKLMASFGEPYRRYRARVPGLWPIPGRSLSADEAARWQSDAAALSADSRTH